MLLLSIHPRFARMILRGEKTIELRRRAPRRHAEFWIALYATSPERALIGLVRASEVLVGPPDILWQYVGDGCGLGQEEYRSYYAGASRAVGIRLTDPIPFESPLRLDRLRCSWPDFRPPRSFAYLADERVQEVESHAGIRIVSGNGGIAHQGKTAGAP